MKIAWVFAALLVLEPVAGQVLIKQVYPDPVNSETGGEFVELWNSGSQEVDISEWVVSTKSNAKDAVVPNGTVLGPFERFLIADSGWSTKKDNAEWPEADVEDSITLVNEIGWVALLNKTGTADFVTWGNGSELNTEQGMAFLRIGSSFVLAEPFTADYGNELGFEAEQGEISAPVVTILPDAEPRKPGIQIRLEPGVDTKVTIRVKADAAEVNAEIQGQTIQLTEADGQWEGQAAFDYKTKPGVIPIVVKIDDNAITTNITILPTAAVKLDSAKLNFGTVFAGRNSTIAGDDDMSTDKPTLQNIGNIPVVVRISGSVTGALLSYSVNGVFEKVGKKPGPSKPIQPGESVPVDFTLSVPRSAEKQEIKAKIALLAQSSPSGS